MLRHCCWDFLVGILIDVIFCLPSFCDSLLLIWRSHSVVQMLCLVMISGDLLSALSFIVFSAVITVLCHFKKTCFSCSKDLH